MNKLSPSAIVAVVVFCIFGIVHAMDHERYVALMHAFGVPCWRFLFFDADMVLSSLRCRRAGFDVFVHNPCDDLGRVFNYSPLWLVGAVLPVTKAWIVPTGLALCFSVLGAFFLLPVRRGWVDTLVMSLACVSYASVYAMERGNYDCLMFSLVVLGCWLLCRRFRAVGYGLIGLAGFLKYYPMLALAMIGKEKPRLFVRYSLLTCAALAGFLALFGTELMRALPLIPKGSPFYDVMFGAPNLPMVIVASTGLPVYFIQGLQLGFLLTASFVAVRIQARMRLAQDLALIPQHSRLFLCAGGLLIIACFISAQNVSYRAMHLIILMPGLLELSRIERNRKVYIGMMGTILALLWVGAWRYWIELLVRAVFHQKFSFTWFASWAIFEILWWVVATFITALLIAEFSTAPILKIRRLW